MTELVNRKRTGGVLMALLIPLGLNAAGGQPAAALSIETAQKARIVLPAQEERNGDWQKAVRRQIVAAANSLCDTQGVAAIYRGGSRRCRQAVIAEGLRQLRAYVEIRTAGRAR